MSDEIAQKTCRLDVCSDCRLICCLGANPPLTLRRKKIIQEYLKENNISSNAPFVDDTYSHPAIDEEGYCIFYSKETGKCQIHEIKPETCRAGPITFDINLSTGRIEWFLKKTEICSLAGELRNNNHALEQHFAIARNEIMRLVRELQPAALKTILLIEEPETTKIGEETLPKEILSKLCSDGHSRRNRC